MDVGESHRLTHATADSVLCYARPPSSPVDHFSLLFTLLEGNGQGGGGDGQRRELSL